MGNSHRSPGPGFRTPFTRAVRGARGTWGANGVKGARGAWSVGNTGAGEGWSRAKDVVEIGAVGVGNGEPSNVVGSEKIGSGVIATGAGVANEKSSTGAGVNCTKGVGVGRCGSKPNGAGVPPNPKDGVGVPGGSLMAAS